MQLPSAFEWIHNGRIERNTGMVCQHSHVATAILLHMPAVDRLTIVIESLRMNGFTSTAPVAAAAV
jgi:hypothetical protein